MDLKAVSALSPSCNTAATHLADGPVQTHDHGRLIHTRPGLIITCLFVNISVICHHFWAGFLVHNRDVSFGLFNFMGDVTIFIRYRFSR